MKLKPATALLLLLAFLVTAAVCLALPIPEALSTNSPHNNSLLLIRSPHHPTASDSQTPQPEYGLLHQGLKNLTEKRRFVLLCAFGALFIVGLAIFVANIFFLRRYRKRRDEKKFEGCGSE
ncbi:hypothetical protein BKA61DRAFT_719891 [Leptodontidium sp. MPI-SDFR-AT-0119]|nr:hypothetical protein BKA61DRAFT_719891 [Leptodontidium sp. MPI-SDFR-AT-0119]